MLPLRVQIVCSVARALLGEVFQALRAVVCRVQSDQAFELRFVVDGPIDSQEDSPSVVHTEVLADFPPDFDIGFVVTRVDAPARIPDDYDIAIFLRRERRPDETARE
jgi:hypothetical protein